MKNKDIILLDLFSGTGGFALGLRSAGFEFKEHYYSEIDKHCIANYSYNFPHAKYTGDIKSIHRGSIPKPNIITFGSPCQDFSLAGRRDGMEGQRSSLILEAIRLITEFRPDLFIWENVKGTFSSNAGEDFWAIIRAFAHIGGYELQWQLVNTKWLLPQNRERIYLVGSLAGRSRPEVFPITKDDILSHDSSRHESLPQYSGTITNNARLRTEDTYIKTARCITGGGHSGGLHSDATYIRKIVKPVLTPHRSKKRQNGRRFKEDGEESFTLTSQDIHGVMIDNNKETTDIRRLTEIECERLQGFPDDWTKIGIYDGQIKSISSTQRYKMIGNAVTSKMVQLIGYKITKSINP